MPDSLRAIDSLLERVTEIAAVEELLATLTAGRGAAVFVEGEPGIGKTALAALARERCAATGIRVLSATGSELDQRLAFGGLRQLLFDLVRSTGPVPGGPASAALTALGLVEPGPAPPDPAAVAHAVRWLVADLAQLQPTVILVDDLQWIDSASRQVIAYLCPRTTDLAVGYLLTSRPDPAVVLDFDRALREADACDVHPAALTLDAVARLASTAVGRDDPDEAFVAACAQATGGNPFLLTELLREIATSEFHGGRDEVARIRALAPRAIQRSVLARLEALDEPARTLARTVAVLPPGVDLELAAAVAELSIGDAVPALRALIAADVLGDFPGLDFVHPVTRAVVAETLSRADTSQGHRRAAEVLRLRGARAEEVAVHLLHASPRGDAADAAMLCRAGESALDSGVPRVAVDYVQRALAEPPPADVRPAVTALLGRALSAAGDPSAVDTLWTAHDAQVDVLARSEVAIDLAESLAGERGRVSEAVQLLHRVARDLPAGGDTRLAVLARLAVFAEYSSNGAELDWCLDQMPAVLSGDTPAERACMVVRATYGTSIEARRLLIPLVHHPGFIAEEVPGSTTVGWAITGLRALGELRLALRFARQAVEHTQRWGRRGAVAQRLCQVAGMQWRLGAIADAEATMVEAAGYLTGDATGLDLTRVASTQLRVALAAGRLDLAEAFSSTAPDTEDTHPFLLLARGELAAAQGDLTRAIELHLSPAARPMRPNPADEGWGHQVATWLATLGRVDEAREILTSIEKTAEQYGAPGAIGRVSTARGAVERDIDLARHGVALLADTELIFDHTDALIDLGMLLRQQRYEREARDVLRAALEQARSMGAGLLATRAESELLAASARSVGRALTGAGSLTPSELRVVQQAASGATNVQVAQQLFLSVKTVEMHLGNAYRKLGIAGRAQLATALNGPQA